MGKCNDCVEFINEIRKSNLIAKTKVKEAYLKHTLLVNLERRQINKIKLESINNPSEVLTMMVDSMDQKKTEVPHFAIKAKKVDAKNNYFFRFHVVGSMMFGHNPCLVTFLADERIEGDFNLHIHAIRRSLLLHKGPLPPHIETCP